MIVSFSGRRAYVYAQEWVFREAGNETLECAICRWIRVVVFTLSFRA